MVEEEKEADAGILFGLSPGILLGVAGIDGAGKLADFAAAAATSSKSAAEKDWESLLEGPWGRPKIFRDAICASEARFAGLSGNALPYSTRGTGASMAPVLRGVLVFDS